MDDRTTPAHWYIVVGQQGRANFEGALKAETWGAKAESKFEDQAQGTIQAGDFVHFIVAPKWAGEGSPPVGFPRVPLERYQVKADEVVVRVTKGMFHDSHPIWDDDIYPVRFQFAVHERKDGVLFSPDGVSDTVRDAVRRSLIGQGRAIFATRVSLRGAIHEVLSTYGEAARRPFPRHPVADVIKRTIPEALKAFLPENRYNVLASVGQGNWAAVPWVAILDVERAVNIRDGLYVAFLFSAELDQVVLALMFGVSGTHGEPARRIRRSVMARVQQVRQGLHLGGQTWQLDRDLALAERGVGAKYADGMVLYRAFSRDRLPSDSEWQDLLQQALELYDGAFNVLNAAPSLLPSAARETTASYGKKAFDLDAAMEILGRLGYRISPERFLNVLLALEVRPFVIFSGRSGTGKTTLSRILAGLFGWEYHQVAVSPAWADPADLLGYMSPLNGQRVPGALESLIRSTHAEPLLCLDEFNVAKVEHYFSDFISAMDAGENGRFWGTNENLSRLSFASKMDLHCPADLRVIATMNFDDSVQSITPRVLDRANLIEFDIQSADELVVNRGLEWSPLDEMVPFAWPWDEKGNMSDDRETEDAIRRLWQSMNGSRGQFGHRAAQEMSQYVALGLLYRGVFSWTEQEARERFLDHQIVERLLPKFHGTASSGDINHLAHLVALLIERPMDGDGAADRQALIDEAHNRGAFPRTVAKIQHLFETYTEDGYASYF